MLWNPPLCMRVHSHRGAELRAQRRGQRVEPGPKMVMRAGVLVDHRSQMPALPFSLGRVVSKTFHAPDVQDEGERFLGVIRPTRCGTPDMIPGVE